ncbi:MAG: late competence development ComFB family protein [Alkalispirochaetaceae bacterium]
MELRRYFDFNDLINEAERLVIDELGRQLDKPENKDLLEKEDYVRDIAAYALNHVQPMYRANLLGRLYARNLEVEEHEEVAEAVQAAIERVRQNP